MTIKDFKKITAEFDDVKSIILRRKVYKKEEARLRRKLKSLNERYSFLKTLVNIDSCGAPLVDAIKKLFMEMGFKKVENVDTKFNEEDIRVWTNDGRLLIIEVTGIDKETVKEAKALQIIKHIPGRKAQHPTIEVFGVFIVNHDNKKALGNRHKSPFTQRLIGYAKAHTTSLTTTIDLFNAFLLFKKNQLTPNGLVDKLCNLGEVKIN